MMRYRAVVTAARIAWRAGASRQVPQWQSATCASSPDTSVSAAERVLRHTLGDLVPVEPELRERLEAAVRSSLVRVDQGRSDLVSGAVVDDLLVECVRHHHIEHAEQLFRYASVNRLNLSPKALTMLALRTTDLNMRNNLLAAAEAEERRAASSPSGGAHDASSSAFVAAEADPFGQGFGDDASYDFNFTGSDSTHMAASAAVSSASETGSDESSAWLGFDTPLFDFVDSMGRLEGEPPAESHTEQEGVHTEQTQALWDRHGEHLSDEERHYLMMRKREEMIEVRAVDMAVERYRRLKQSAEDRRAGAQLPPGQALLLRWFEPLVEAVREEQEDIGQKKSRAVDRTIYGPFLMLLPAEKLSVITLHEVLSSVLLEQPYGAPFTKVSSAVGQAVEAEIALQRLRRQKGRLHDLMAKDKKSISVRGVNKYVRMAMEEQAWPTRVQVKVGACLIDLLMQSAMIEESLPDAQAGLSNRGGYYGAELVPQVPAFFHHYAKRSRKTVGMLQAHENLFQLIERGHQVREALRPRYMPMVVKPRPWSETVDGGYLFHRNSIMRTRGSRMQQRALRESRGTMDLVYQGLNAVASTEWEVNEDVYDVVVKAWQDGGGIADLPQRHDFDLPDPPATEPRDDDPEWADYYRQCNKIGHMNRNLHALRCDTTYKIEVARDFLRERFYFPHNLDFRGRAYPVPPHLNHLGSDLCRGLLKFSERRPLGARGLWWLKVQLANLYGRDKLPLDERVQFAEDVLLDAFQAAADPLGRGTWWLGAEDPWQCLAVCFELRNAYESRDPEHYMSSLPVHQDGSCNGLQHYAALGRDTLGGQQVNLVPSERPQDVYSGVLSLVVRRMERDAQSPDDRRREIATALQGKVVRKVIKQTVMTSVYGVTFVGARKQIQGQLEDIAARGDIAEELVYEAACYLARTTLDSLGELFTGAKNIMEWLGQCARAISLEGKDAVRWTTPLGLPVVQPYRKGGKQMIRTIVQHVCVATDRDELPVAVARQKSAFPPNYVHSLDSSHMLLTAAECARRGIVFAGVHDSFWTHASTIDDMSAVLRDQFVHLHSQPLLESLRNDFAVRYPDVAFPELPALGDLDIACVKQSRYFFH